jgi:hypothetical protein
VFACFIVLAVPFALAKTPCASASTPTLTPTCTPPHPTPSRATPNPHPTPTITSVRASPHQPTHPTPPHPTPAPPHPGPTPAPPRPPGAQERRRHRVQRLRQRSRQPRGLLLQERRAGAGVRQGGARGRGAAAGQAGSLWRARPGATRLGPSFAAETAGRRGRPAAPLPALASLSGGPAAPAPSRRCAEPDAARPHPHPAPTATATPPPPPPQAIEAHLRQQPHLLPEILKTLFEIILFEECSNQWSLSRPMLSLILINEAVYPDLQRQVRHGGPLVRALGRVVLLPLLPLGCGRLAPALITPCKPRPPRPPHPTPPHSTPPHQIIMGQPTERQAHLAACLEKLMADVGRNLDAKNRDKFTQNLTIVRCGSPGAVRGQSGANTGTERVCWT